MLVDKTILDSKTGCWIWQGAIGNRGYGQLKVKGRSWRAHRYFYETSRGKIKNGMVLDHVCRNIVCVNPDHLEMVTVAENTRRGRSAKLNYSKVANIKKLYTSGLSQTKISKLFNINQGQVSRIVLGKAWSLTM